MGERPCLSIHLFKYFNLRTVGLMKFDTEGLSEKSDVFNFCTVQLHRSIVGSELLESARSDHSIQLQNPVFGKHTFHCTLHLSDCVLLREVSNVHRKLSFDCGVLYVEIVPGWFFFMSC
jgi:hypothetical protein